MPGSLGVQRVRVQRFDALRGAPGTVGLSIEEQLLHRNVKRFRGGLVFKAHRWLYHSTLGSIVIKKKKRSLAATASNASVSNASMPFEVDPKR